MSSRYRLPKTRPEPTTRPEIVEEIAWLQEHRRGSSRYIQWWIDKRIAELQKLMEGLKCSKTTD